ncbi:MAG: PQQ-dependent sugar dehydrogenase [Gemmatimonas sp.]
MVDLRCVSAMLSLGLLVAAAPAIAADAPLRTGKDAFGDWKADSPGVRRLIRPQDLPEPYATGAAASRAELKPLPAAGPKLPPGFKAEVIAKDLNTPRVIRVAPDGTIFVAESGGRNDFAISEDAESVTGKGAIRAIRFKPDGTVESARFAENLARPYGIALWPANDPRYVYVGETNRVVRFPYKAGSLTAAGPMEVVVPRIPTTQRGHWTRDLAFSPDGKTLYIAVGSSSNIADGMPADPPGGLDAWAKSHALGAAWGREERRADVLSVDPDGKNLKVFATGLRNCAGMTVQPGTGELWCVVNERDGLGDNLPPDYATHVQAGKFYGWPWYYIGANEEPSLAGKRPDLKNQVTVPDVLFQPHSAPLNIVFYEGDQFPSEYKGSAFVAMHGSWNRDQRTGYKLVRLPMKDGKATGEYEDFLTGLVDPNGGVLGRPVGLAVAKDGSLLFSEDGNNTVWRISYTRRQASTR